MRGTFAPAETILSSPSTDQGPPYYFCLKSCLDTNHSSYLLPILQDFLTNPCNLNSSIIQRNAWTANVLQTWKWCKSNKEDQKQVNGCGARYLWYPGSHAFKLSSKYSVYLFSGEKCLALTEKHLTSQKGPDSSCLSQTCSNLNWLS